MTSNNNVYVNGYGGAVKNSNFTNVNLTSQLWIFNHNTN